MLKTVPEQAVCCIWCGLCDFSRRDYAVHTKPEERRTMDANIIAHLRTHGRWRKLAGLVADRDEDTRNMTATIMQKLNPRYAKETATLTHEEQELLEELYTQLQEQ